MNTSGTDTLAILYAFAIFMAFVAAMPKPEDMRNMPLGFFLYSWIWSFLQLACMNIQHVNPALGAITRRTETQTDDGRGNTAKTTDIAVALPPTERK